MRAVFIILLIVTAFICVAMTYFQLAAEDHRWWWRSFFCGGSTGARPAAWGLPAWTGCPAYQHVSCTPTSMAPVHGVA